MKHQNCLLFFFAWICLPHPGCSNDRASTDASVPIAALDAGDSAETGRVSVSDAKVAVDATTVDCCSIEAGVADSPLSNESQPEAAMATDANRALDAGLNLDSAKALDVVIFEDSNTVIDAGSVPECPNLSGYRFDREMVLPEISAEASGIAWNSDANTFFVVANLQGRFWEFDRTFQTVLRTITIENMDNDTEGITYLGEDRVAIAAESNTVYVADLSDGVTTVSGSDSNRVQLIQPSAAPPVVNAGLEGIAYQPPSTGLNGRFFSCQEHLPMRVLQFEYNATPPPFEPKSVLDGTLQVEEPWDAQQRLSSNVTDIAGMTYDKSNDTLLIVSQESRSVIRINPKTGTVSETLSLSNTDTCEGITLFDHCLLAIVSEPNRVQIYRPENE